MDKWAWKCRLQTIFDATTIISVFVIVSTGTTTIGDRQAGRDTQAMNLIIDYGKKLCKAVLQRTTTHARAHSLTSLSLLTCTVWRIQPASRDNKVLSISLNYSVHKVIHMCLNLTAPLNNHARALVPNFKDETFQYFLFHITNI